MYENEIANKNLLCMLCGYLGKAMTGLHIYYYFVSVLALNSVLHFIIILKTIFFSHDLNIFDGFFTFIRFKGILLAL